MANQDRRMIPLGIDLNDIPSEDPDSLALVPVDEPQPLAVIPPKPRCYGQSFYAQPVLTAPPQPLLLKDAPPKGPIVKLPEGTKILPPKHNETLLGVKTNRSGEIICAEYSTGERTYFEGVRAHPSKVKFILPKDAPKHSLAASEAPRKRRKTVADVMKELEKQSATISSIESSLRLQGRCILHTNTKLEKLEKTDKKSEKRLSALEPPKPQE